MKRLSLILLATGALSAHAGVGAHGGNVVACQGKVPVTLDYYNAMLPTASGPVQVVDVSGMSEDEAFKFVRSRFDGSPFQRTFDNYTKTLGPPSSWIAADLKSIDDSNEPYALPATCTRQTAAARQGTMMYIDLSVTSTMSPGQIGLLHAHEVLYAISNMDSSAVVRDVFRVILSASVDWDLFERLMLPIRELPMWNYILRTLAWYPGKGNPVKIAGVFRVNNCVGCGPKAPGDLPMLYAESPGQASDLIFKCDLPSQSCTVIREEPWSGSKVRSFKGCVLRSDDFDKFTMTCPQLGGTATFTTQH